MLTVNDVQNFIDNYMPDDDRIDSKWIESQPGFKEVVFYWDRLNGLVYIKIDKRRVYETFDDEESLRKAVDYYNSVTGFNHL